MLALILVASTPFLPGSALAQDDASHDRERRGFSFDLSLAAGAAAAEFTESDSAVADFEAFALGGSARFGWFVGPHVLLGAELASAWHSSVGEVDVRELGYFSQGQSRQASYTTILPLGVFVEVYPWLDAGWFAAVGGAVGWIDLTAFSVGAKEVYAAGYSLDVGYELSGRSKRGPAVFARYSRWAGEEFFAEQADGLVSRELLVGLRWSFWTPEWSPQLSE